MRLIDANEFENQLYNTVYDIAENDAFGHLQLGYSKGIIHEVLKQTKTVDAVEVVHSSWVLNDSGSGTCKHCHRTAKNVWDYDNWMNYCPNCGARMDGDGNG